MCNHNMQSESLSRRRIDMLHVNQLRLGIQVAGDPHWPPVVGLGMPRIVETVDMSGNRAQEKLFAALLNGSRQLDRRRVALLP